MEISYLDWIDRWMLASDHLCRLDSEKRRYGVAGTHVLGFVYVDHTHGISMQIESFCNMDPDGTVHMNGSPPQHNSMLLIRYDMLLDMDPNPLADDEHRRLGLPEYPKWLPSYHHEGAEPLRRLSLLHPLRAEGYPDDIKFVLPGDAEHQAELIWGRLENSLGGDYFECELLNEPNHDFGFHMGERVLVRVKEVPEGVSSVCLGPLPRFAEDKV